MIFSFIFAQTLLYFFSFFSVIQIFSPFLYCGIFFRWMNWVQLFVAARFRVITQISFFLQFSQANNLYSSYIFIQISLTLFFRTYKLEMKSSKTCKSLKDQKLVSLFLCRSLCIFAFFRFFISMCFSNIFTYVIFFVLFYVCSLIFWWWMSWV